MGEENKNEPELYSLELAYDFVMPSYNWMLQRLESVERRLQGLLLYFATLTFAIPVATIAIAGDSKTLNGLGWAPIAAVVCYLLATVLGLCARAFGKLTLAYPESMVLEKQVEKTIPEFQRNRIRLSDEHYKDNINLVSRKSFAADAMSAILLVEVVCWLWWAYNTLS